MGLSEMMGSFAGGSCDSMALLMGGGSEGTLSDNDSRGDDDDDYSTCFLILMFSNATESALR